KQVQAVEQVACDPRWYISLGLGIDIDTQVTNFVNGTSFEPYAGEPYYQEQYKTRSYDDVYNNSIYRIQTEFGYVWSDHIELFAMGKYAGGYGKHYIDRDSEGGFA